MKKYLKILTTYSFLIGLILLLLNDFVFKNLFGNWVTGKLSDFAGLFIFPLFWAALFPRHKKKIFLLTGLFFIYWKSPYSQQLIDHWNGLGLLTISRVVDLSDLIALSVLPLAYYTLQCKENLKTLNVHPVIPLIVAVFSFVATSTQQTVPFNKRYELDFSKDTLSRRLSRIDTITIHNITRNTSDSVYYQNKVRFSHSKPDTTQMSIPWQICPDWTYGARVIVKEPSENRTVVTLKNAHTFNCPDEESQEIKKAAMESFEKYVIDKVEGKH